MRGAGGESTLGFGLVLDDVRGSRSGLETRTLRLGTTGHPVLHKTVIGREMAVTCQVGGRNMPLAV